MNIQEEKINGRLYMLAVILGVFLALSLWYLTSAWHQVPDGSTKELFVNLIPNILATLLTALIVYFFLKNKVVGKEIIDIKSDYHFHKWGKYIKKARKIDIVANYFDSWLRKHQIEIVGFLKRGGKIRVIMTATDDSNEMLLVLRRFSDMKGIDELKFRINNTTKVLEETSRRYKIPSESIEVYHFEQATSYPLVRIDDRLIIFSHFKHNPDYEFDAPSIMINIENDPNTRAFWAKEFEYLFENSKRIVL